MFFCGIDDRDIYMCVNKSGTKKWNICAVLSNVHCFLYLIPFHLDFYI